MLTVLVLVIALPFCIWIGVKVEDLVRDVRNDIRGG
jgi:hypothetical protein